MSKLTEYLAELNINTYSALDTYIYNTDIDTLFNLVIYLRDLIDKDFIIPQYTPFSFVPSDELSGTGGCSEISCKSRRATRFANFSSLYADSIYIKLNTITFEHLEAFFDDICSNEMMEYKFRYALFCDINIINIYTPLINANIVYIEPTRKLYCKDCFQKALLNIEHPIDISPIINYVKTNAIINIDEYNFDSKHMAISISNLENFFDSESGIYLLNEDFINALPSTYQPSNILDKNIPVVSDMLTNIVESAFVDCCYYTAYCNNSHSKLITSTPSNALFMDYTNKQLPINDIINSLSTLPEYELPFSKTQSLDTVLHLREIEKESFNRYRNALNTAVKEQTKTTSSFDWYNIYDDIIYPEFCNLDSKLKNLKTGAFKKTFQNLALTSAIVTAGVLSGTITQSIPGIITSLGGISGTIGLGHKVLDHNPPIKDQLRENDFYFLWKLKNQ